MPKLKICVYAICKDEAGFVDRWMDAVSEADLVVVVDTGSADDTVARLKARGAIVYEEQIVPWRFDTARNQAMDHIPDDVDLCVSNDLDEVFEPGWRQILEDAWESHYTRARYWFAWSHGTDGRVRKRYPMEKIHRRQNFRWIHPVHEVLAYDGADEDQTVWIDRLVLHHRPDLTKPRSQYLPLLEMSAAENPDDDRTMFWLGREYIFHQKFDDGIRTLTHHLTMPAAKWDEERSASMSYIAKAYQAKQDHQTALSWLYRAIAECPHTREPWLNLASLGYDLADWPLTFWAVKKGLGITQPTDSYLTDPLAWGHGLYDYGAIACYRLGLYEQARIYALTAATLSPEDPRLAQNLALIRLKTDGGMSHE